MGHQCQVQRGQPKPISPTENTLLAANLIPNDEMEPRPNSVTDRGSVQNNSLEMSAGSSPGLSTILAGQEIQLNRRSLYLSPVLQPSQKIENHATCPCAKILKNIIFLFIFSYEWRLFSGGWSPHIDYPGELFQREPPHWWGLFGMKKL